jgi:hypothetical protein
VATWQAPTVAITTPRTTKVNRLVLWGNTTEDTLTQATMKMDGMTFTNTSNENIIVIDQVNSNTSIGIRIFANTTTGAANVSLGDDILNALTTGSFKYRVGFNRAAISYN